jgi:hypothetical protein
MDKCTNITPAVEVVRDSRSEHSTRYIAVACLKALVYTTTRIPDVVGFAMEHELTFVAMNRTFEVFQLVQLEVFPFLRLQLSPKISRTKLIHRSLARLTDFESHLRGHVFGRMVPGWCMLAQPPLLFVAHSRRPCWPMRRCHCLL